MRLGTHIGEMHSTFSGEVSRPDSGPSEYRRRLYPARHPSCGRLPYTSVKSAGQTPDHLQNTRGASALARLWTICRIAQAPVAREARNRVEATLQGLDSNTPRPPIFVLLVSPPHLSVPRAIDYFTLSAQSRRNRSLCTSHSNHRPGLN